MSIAAILLDLVLLAILVIAAFGGYRKGMLATLISLVGGIAVLFVSILLASPTAKLIEPHMQGEQASEVSYAFAFVVLFLILQVVLRILISLAKKFNKIPVLGHANRLLGLVLGLIYGIILAWAVAAAFQLALPVLPAAKGEFFHGFEKNQAFLYPLLSQINPVALLTSVFVR